MALTNCHAAFHTSDMFRDISRCNKISIEQTGDLDIPAVAAILEVALADARLRATVTLALADFIARAIDGAVPDPASWTPPAPR